MTTSRVALTTRCYEQGSTLVIVLWIAIGLVSLTLYFAQSMLSEVRASDHRVEGLAAEQAIDGGLRYAMAVLGNQLTNGYVPDPGSYLSEAAGMGGAREGQDSGARFWFIGRDTNSTSPSKLVSFGLLDEGSKININTARSNVLYYLSDWDIDITEAILDWRNTNGPGTTVGWYGMQVPSYECKQAPFETVEELGLVLGITPEFLRGEDLNRNGVLDPNETDEDRNGLVSSGLLDLVTVYSREPNTYNNGTPRVNIRLLTSASQEFSLLLQESIGATRANIILQQLGLSGGGGGGGGGQQTFNSPLELYRRGGFTLEEFAEIADKITTVEGEFVEGRINVNTAPARVLSCLPGLADSPDLVDLLVSYRLTNPTRLSSVAWVVEALGQNNQEVISQLERRDMLTTRSYQHTADVAATGAYGRGYRRTRFVIDTAMGTPRVVYRRDLTSLGWALGKEVRNQLFPSNSKNGSMAFN